MQKTWLISVVLLIFSATVFAQRGKKNGQGPLGIKISGTILDEKKTPIPYASVALFSTRDSSQIKGTASNFDGEFSLFARPGKYFIKISFLSFKQKTLPVFNLKPPGIALGDITLVSNDIPIQEVTVEAEKSQVEIKLDKRVFNVGKDLSNAGGNAQEILENIPSVSVDVDGNVNLRGSDNVRILIDGKPSGMVGISSTDALRQLQGNMVEKVEVITNPSARYDAEGEVGIINIVLKKQVQKGINGSIQLQTGWPHNHGGSVQLNYRKEKINFFVSYGLNYRERPGNGYSIQDFFFPDTSYTFRRNRQHQRGGLSNNVRFGANYFFNSKNTLTTSLFFKNSNGNNRADLTYEDFNNAGELIRIVDRMETEKEQQTNAEINLNYEKKFDRKEQVWTVDFKWMLSEDSELARQTETSSLPTDPTLMQRNSNEEDEAGWLFQTDYVKPFSKNGKWEFGLKSNARKLNNNFKAEQQNNDLSWNIIQGFDNHFVYDESIHAGYVMFGNQAGNFSYQLGLRNEYSNIKTTLKNTKEENPRQYNNLFPSTHLSYKLSEQKSIQLSYSKRIRRPRFWDLLPFFGYTDSRVLFNGNPNLDPELTDSFESGYLIQRGKGSILSSIYYRHGVNSIQRVWTIDSTGITRIFPINAGIRNSYGLEFSYSYRLKRKLFFNGSANFFKLVENASYENINLNNETYAFQTRSTLRLSFPKDLDIQFSMNYRAPRQTAQGRMKSMYSLDIGMSKDVLKRNGTLTFKATDLFNTRKRRGINEGEFFQSESEFQWRARQFVLSFTYRINQKKQRNPFLSQKVQQ